MRYGEYLEQNSVPGWHAHYLNYGQLKQAIEGGGEGQDGGFSDAAFVAAVTHEQMRTGLFIKGKVVEVGALPYAACVSSALQRCFLR